SSHHKLNPHERALKIMASTKTKLAVAAVLAASLVSVPLAVNHFTHPASSARDVDISRPKNEPESIYKTIGAATPEAGLQRLVAASQNGDINSAITFLSWQRGDKVPQETGFVWSAKATS